MANRLLDTVIDNHFCVGCGVCTAVSGSPMKIRTDGYGCYQAHAEFPAVSAEVDAALQRVCPFSDKSDNEDVLSAALYPQSRYQARYLGRYQSTYVGWVEEGGFRTGGSSGGMTSWILCELLERKLVDYVVNVRPSEEDKNALFKFRVSHTPEEVRHGAKSRYYPVNYASVLEHVRRSSGRCAIVGLPCFIKAIRLLCREEPELASKICFAIGIFCGHLKSAKYMELFCRDMGIEPRDVLSFDFRKKFENENAHNYGIEIVARDQQGGQKVFAKQARYVFGTNWGYNLLKYNACDFCDDVFGETADIVIGDAWIPGHDADWRGTNVIVIRSKEIEQIVEAAQRDRRVALTAISAKTTVSSQAAAVRHRREGLAYRLQHEMRRSPYVPRKRVKPAGILQRFGAKIFIPRMELARRSHELFAAVVDEESYQKFKQEIQVLMDRYDRKRRMSRAALVKRGLAWLWLRFFHRA